MLYISLSAVFIVVYIEYKVNKIYSNSKHNRRDLLSAVYMGNRYADSEYVIVNNICVCICCCFRIKCKQNVCLFVKVCLFVCLFVC